ncbi:4-alpha-glucanotransferase [Shewanella litorisediminis]|uniref:4-alpha-glucanotransferase n=1 Tax=Shewanella litorisediminis TaxID=1173586 RepID=A0ABX7G0D7_9GAMM|nr:4-alpha-glucanotransferase [Shewanella litorisediminis]MCL2918207.1 4-alpha-glucanotransferase [Shewanella litorisediminis]QRH00740.1 4-alpha-glucanotransferase [Shewanella litorisediminis]
MGLEKLFYLQGVGDRFIDCDGREQAIPESARLAMLRALMGLEQSPDEADIAARVETLDSTPWTQLLLPLQWCFDSRPSFECQLPENRMLDMVLTLISEQGERRTLTLLAKDAETSGDYQRPDGRYLRCRYTLPPLGMGEYQLLLSHPVLGQGKGTLLMIPEQAYGGTQSPGKRPWGLGISLFTLRSPRQWGMGDLGDLQTLIELAAEAGCDFITLTPLHAPDIANPELASPYSPWDRRFLNPLYIAIDLVTEYSQFAQEFNGGDWLRERLILNQATLIDYPKLALLKYRALAKLFAAFWQLDELTGRRVRFERFVAGGGAALMDFCRDVSQRASALESEWHSDPLLADALQRAEFHAWLQFVADEQLSLCQLRCRQVGMSLGLVRDLAVGALAIGSEVSRSGVFCQGADIGAPPDPFARQGQNWGMPPMDPVALKDSALSHLKALYRSNMQSCGALRIDHVMALTRLWCWPKDDENGCYLYYPQELMLAVLCLESHKNRCVLIGEDLGTVPPLLKGLLRERGILGNDVFYFCREGGGFSPPREHRVGALLQLGNQDVPPFMAWWRGIDLGLLKQLGLIPSLTGAREERIALCRGLLQNLVQAGCLPTEALGWGACDGLFSGPEEAEAQVPTGTVAAGFHEAKAVFDALLSWLPCSRARLFSVSLWDLALESLPINIPGTSFDYPNWRARMSKSLETLWQNREFRARLESIRVARSHSHAGRHNEPARGDAMAYAEDSERQH